MILSREVSEESSKNYSGRLIQDGTHSGAFNMAADLYFSQESERTSEPYLRLYAWDKPTLSLGFHQKISETIRKRCQEIGIPIVRRPTGGRAVLHHRELTYCLCLPLKHPLFQSARGELLRQIGTIFVSAANEIGIGAELVRVGSRDAGNKGVLRKASPLCFDSASRWEVQISGRKWIGSAQRFFPDVLLQHGSILLADSDVNLAALFGLSGRSSEKIKDQSRHRWDRLAAKIKLDDLRSAIPATFRRFWGISWRQEPLSAAETELIASSAQDYQNHWGRGRLLESDQAPTKFDELTTTET